MLYDSLCNNISESDAQDPADLNGMIDAIVYRFVHKDRERYE